MSHTRRQWIVSHRWMINPMQQTEWIKGQGILIWLAEVFSSLGTGLYLVSIFVNNWWGALFGWLIIVGLKLPLHFFYLGRPMRFWRAFPPFTRAWRTSWIARGFFFTTLYAGFAFFQLITGYLLSTSGAVATDTVSTLFVLDAGLKILAGITAVLTAIYCGFMMSFCKSVPFWNTGLLPIVIMNAGIADGLALMIGVGLFFGGVDLVMMEAVTRILLLANVLLIGTYLLNATYGSKASKLAAKEMTIGSNAPIFWIGVVLCGILIPLVISVSGYIWSDIGHGLHILAIVSHTAGAFSLKYCILNVGIYEPLFSVGKKV
jgi:formate-dependent nitrite reductase membrane component NrfD